MATLPEERAEVGEAVEINVRRICGTVVGAEAVVHGGGQRSGVASGLHVHFGIADENRFVWRGSEFAQNRMGAKGIRFFCFKAVAAIDRAKIFGEAEAFKNAHADAHGLVRQDGHRISREMFERFGNARIGAGVVQFVLVVVGQEELQRPFTFLVAGVPAQRAPDQLRRAVADIAGDGDLVQFLAAHFLKHSVDGEDQVALGIDERAVEVKDQRADGRKTRSSHEPDIVIRQRFAGGHTYRIKCT